ncbi:lipoprotein, putative [Pseudooceanicola batsensis HTCC2597]|uniref:Lipoprotein, putative n=2 Tax=Pseudooceanicola batsensis TaxID=314255 RepID=A3TW80_PSEBH|nr:lipoprotein, putative [Pseudooceanicola batsensis HTCC2597]
MALAALPLAGCGFAPAYGPAGGADVLTRSIALTPPETRRDYLLARHVERRLGRAADPAFLLDVDLDIREERIAITDANITRRFDLVGNADYTLTTADGAEVARGRVSSFTGYSATGTTVATRAARGDAEERLMTMLADQIVTRLIAAAPTLPGS